MKRTSILLVFVSLVFLCACAAGGYRAKGPESAILRISCDRNFAPFTYVDAAGKPAGMLVDIWSLWVERTGQAVRFVFSDWDGSVQALKDGSAEIHSGLFKNESRAKWMDFSTPVYQSGIAVFVPDTPGGPKSLEDLRGKKAGALDGGAPLDYLKGAAPETTVQGYRGYREMIGDASSGKIAAFADEEVGGWTALAELGLSERFTTIPGAYVPRQFFAAVRKGNDRILMLVNQGLSQIRPEELAAIEALWIPQNARHLTPAKGAAQQ
ncbi:MAG: transporter substrate-binding domain-containing protein [Thermodesulfobacteriota bacterium]